jgi:hypothetical protein
MIMELNSRLIKKNNPNKDQMDKELKEAYMCLWVYIYIWVLWFVVYKPNQQIKSEHPSLKYVINS